MKNTNKRRFSAAILAAMLIPAALFSCSGSTDNSSSDADIPEANTTAATAPQVEVPVTTAKIGSIVVNAGLTQEVKENDTMFKLNSVIDAGLTDDGQRFIFFDVNIRNDLDIAYDLNTLNNFYLVLPDGSEMYSTVRAQLYAINNFKEDKFLVDPFEVPAKSEISGVMGGFLIDKDIDHFTVCFFPTKDNPTDKELVVKIDVTADDFKSPDADILK